MQFLIFFQQICPCISVLPFQITRHHLIDSDQRHSSCVIQDGVPLIFQDVYPFAFFMLLEVRKTSCGSAAAHRMSHAIYICYRKKAALHFQLKAILLISQNWLVPFILPKT